MRATLVTNAFSTRCIRRESSRRLPAAALDPLRPGPSVLREEAPIPKQQPVMGDGTCHENLSAHLICAKQLEFDKLEYHNPSFATVDYFPFLTPAPMKQPHLCLAFFEKLEQSG